MTLLNAPAYDNRKERRKTGLLIGIGVFIALFIMLWLGGYILGHGWFFSNLPAERREKIRLHFLQWTDDGPLDPDLYEQLLDGIVGLLPIFQQLKGIIV